MKTPHPYAEILRAIADGETVQWLSDGNWSQQGQALTLKEIADEDFLPDRYRIKPRTIRVGEVDVPEPMRSKPEVGTKYFIACPAEHSYYMRSNWDDHGIDNTWLERGLCYSNPTDAETAGRAIAALFAKDKP